MAKSHEPVLEFLKASEGVSDLRDLRHFNPARVSINSKGNRYVKSTSTSVRFFKSSRRLR